MKKIIPGLIGLALATALVGCGGQENKEMSVNDLPEPRFEADANVPSWQKDHDYEATLTWYINYEWWAYPGWGVDAVTRQMKEDMNINIEFIVGNSENLNTMMASGELPDIVTMGGYEGIAKEADRFALPLNVLAETYDPYFTEHAASSDALVWYTQEDGNVYTYPSFSASYSDFENGWIQGDQALIVRRDIYEAIGEPDMSTPEGFLTALRLAKEHQSETDHGTALVPFASEALNIAGGQAGALDWVLQDFLGLPLHVDGIIYDRDADSEYLTWLKVIRQAYEDGLMTNDQFSDDDNTIKEKLSQGTYFAYLHGNIVGLSEFLSDNNIRNIEQEYVVVPGPRHSDGRDHTFAGGGIGGWTNTFITTSTDDPQTAMQVLTYLASDHGNMVNSFGIEGETYEMVDGQAVLTDEVLYLRDNDFAAFNEQIGIGTYWFLASRAFAFSMGELQPEPIRGMVEWGANYVEPRFEIEDIDPTPGTSLARNLATIGTDRVEAIVAVIQAPDDAAADQIWSDFLENREANNWSEIREYQSDRIKENLEILANMR